MAFNFEKDFFEPTRLAIEEQQLAERCSYCKTKFKFKHSIKCECCGASKQ